MKRERLMILCLCLGLFSGCLFEENEQSKENSSEDTLIVKWNYGGGIELPEHKKNSKDETPAIEKIKQLWCILTSAIRDRKSLPDYFGSEFFIQSEIWKSQSSSAELRIVEATLNLMKCRIELATGQIGESKTGIKKRLLEKQFIVLSEMLNSGDFEYEILKTVEDEIIKITDELMITSNLNKQEKIKFLEILRQIV